MKSVFISYEKEFEKIKQIISKYEYISFDVFDTLIKRNVQNPFDIFYLIEKEAINNGIKISNLYNKRISALAHSKDNPNFEGLYNIYNYIINKENMDSKYIDQLVEIEKKIELDFCTPNLYVKKIYEYCLENNKKIIAVSDMYLSTKFIKMMLNKCGYKIDNLFVSIDCLSKKRNGSLYRYVLDKMSIINNKKIIHIGDDFKGDYVGAKLARIRPIRIKKNFRNYRLRNLNTCVYDQFSFNVVDSFINNNLCFDQNYYYKFGLSMIGPIVLNYSIWLLNNLKKNGIKNAFFFSRDGYVLKKAFDIINNTDISSNYLYVSRRALFVPSIHKRPELLETNELINYLPSTRIISLKSIIEFFGLEYSKYIQLAEKYDLSIDMETSKYELMKNEKFKSFFSDIKSDILSNSIKEFNNLKKYFKYSHFEGDVAIIDVGWHGSMQHHLEWLDSDKELNLNLYGFYVGICPSKYELNNFEGFIRDSRESSYAESSKAFIGLIESVFFAPEGSLKKYNDDPSKKPVLLDYEYGCKGIEYCSFEQIQLGILDYVKKSFESVNKYSITLNGYDSYLFLKKYGLSPYKKDILMFKDFKYLSEDITKFVEYKGLKHYLFNFKEMKRDLLKSRWKTGFFRLLFKFNLNYYKLYLKLSKGKRK